MSHQLKQKWGGYYFQNQKITEVEILIALIPFLETTRIIFVPKFDVMSNFWVENHNQREMKRRKKKGKNKERKEYIATV